MKFHISKEWVMRQARKEEGLEIGAASMPEDVGSCGMCDGTGLIDGYDDDPNWYAPGETKPCPQCGGTGI